MDTHIPTTPFGRRPLSLAILNGRRLADECKPDAQADKWKLFRAVCEAKIVVGATDRALAVLNALLTFHREPELKGSENLVVFPSNQQLALRAHGMAPATLRRHLAVLVDCGLIARRDSPNGKRFARKGQGGDIAQAYGFDLAPLLARAAEFERLAEEVRAERQALHLMRERVTLLRRDIAKMITFGIEEAIPADWQDWHLRFRSIVVRIPRTATREELRPLEAELAQLAEMIRNVLEAFEKSRNTSANESQTERHIHNSNPKSTFELEPGSGNEPGPTDAPDQPTAYEAAKVAQPQTACGIPVKPGNARLPGHCRLPPHADYRLERPGRDRQSGARRARRQPAGVERGLRGHGQDRRSDRCRRNPAAIRPDRQRRWLSAGADRQSQGRGLLGGPGADGVAARPLPRRCDQGRVK